MTQDLSLAVAPEQDVKLLQNPHKVCNFTHLHLHTPWSLLDGFCRIDDLMDLVLEYGMDSVGVSEHGTCQSHVEFYKKAKEKGIKPILGCEVYITPNRHWKKAEFNKPIYKAEDSFVIPKKDLKDLDEYIELPEEMYTKAHWLELEQHKENMQNKRLKLVHAVPNKTMSNHFSWRPNMAHLLLIAKNNEGYSNLLELTSRAFLEGFYSKPRADYELIKKYGKGLIATTACLGGEVPQLIRQGRHKVAKNLIKFYQECFDELYLEIQPSDMPEQILVNEVLKQWSKELDIPLIATSDAHMLTKDEKPIHAALTTIGKSEDDSDISVYEHCYFMSSKEMIEHDIPQEALENAYDVAQRCNVELELGKIKLPEFTVPQGYDFDNYLSHLTSQYLFEMALEQDIDIDKYQERLNYELSVIKEKGFSGYFLIVWDFIKYAKDNGILVGPGRGSGAGSLTAYLLKIVNIDPIKYNLLFERFLNPERPTFPDFDIDFDYLRRHEVIDYITNKYGEENVAQIGTYTTLSTKAAFKDVGRGLGIDHNLINEMNKLIPSKFGKTYTIQQSLEEVPALREWQQRYPDLFETALKVEKLPRSSSIHACGIVIANQPLAKNIPISRGKNGEVVTQYEGPLLEEIGYIKFDLLGLKNLSVIDIARNLVKERHGVEIDPDTLEPIDPKVFDTIKQGNTLGLFQIESPGMQKMFKGMNKVDFEILNAGIALYRPGPMENIPEFQARANGMKEFEYLSPEVEEVTKSTFGILVYQEQIMQLAVKLAGYTAGESDVLRKAVGKKKESVMRPALKELHERILGKGHSKELADKMIEMIEPFVGYGFNRSHSAAYAFVAYQTAYFKTYYPIEFMAALLTIFGDDEDKVTEYIAEAKRMGIGIKPPDINLSQKGFTINGSDLIYGLGSIKGLGEAAIHNIMEARPFESMSHLIETVPKKQLNKRAIEALIFSGALDTIDEQIKALPTRMHIFDTVLKMRGDNIDLTEQINNFTKVDQYNLEHKLIGIFVSGHPLEDIAQPIDWDGMDFDERFQTAGIVTHVVETKTKMTQQPMAIINVDTLEGNKKVIIFPDQYAALDARLQQGLILKMNLTIKFNSNPNYEQRTIIAQKVTIPKRINKHILNPS